MTTTVAVKTPDQVERPSRRRPFTSWMKKLANLKSGSSTTADNNQTLSKKRNNYPVKNCTKKSAFPLNINHRSESPYINGDIATDIATEIVTQSSSSLPSANLSRCSIDQEDLNQNFDDKPPTTGDKSTIETSTGRANSVVAPSHAPSSGQGTNGTIGYGIRGNDSTFSSPAPSVRSLTTTLTTLHSAAPTATTPNNPNSNFVSILFTHQFPSSSQLNALPSHLAPQSGGGQPSTYNTATANNLLTDNASILTLASSSKRRRRRSMDTDASVRALAPSSLFGGSRESLPLSVLSTNIEQSSHQQRPSIGGLNERGSIYSTAGVVSALSSERNSYYAGKQLVTTENGSLLQNSPLTSPRDFLVSNSGKLIQPETIKDEDKNENEIKESSGHKL
ncbi:hypothetical protein OnM2_039019 [Erysiphe neolycopersici]|uniref:Ca2+-modulated nonselective cation channel polycystin n=1 Tax=Erysiphe neolycopersici TaxID=212602 RepID=A0A420HW64_9PEZI|nr:hypothetical protein OnM2_039019 [Erysiphe neolycopersici]